MELKNRVARVPQAEGIRTVRLIVFLTIPLFFVTGTSVHAAIIPSDNPGVQVFGQGAFGYNGHQQQPLGSGYSGIISDVQMYVHLRTANETAFYQLCANSTDNMCGPGSTDLGHATATLADSATEGWITFTFPSPITLSPDENLYAAFCPADDAAPNAGYCVTATGTEIAFSGLDNKPATWPSYGFYWTQKFDSNISVQDIYSQLVKALSVVLSLLQQLARTSLRLP